MISMVMLTHSWGGWVSGNRTHFSASALSWKDIRGAWKPPRPQGGCRTPQPSSGSPPQSWPGGEIETFETFNWKNSKWNENLKFNLKK